MQLKVHTALLLWVLSALPSSAAAYSSFGDYARSIEEGGGGGKFFTGTPADGYTCDVCHSGAPSAALDVIGLPEAGYVPGQTYEISFQWQAPRVALMAELTDLGGTPAGTTSLIPYMAWTDAEKCAADGFPAADMCRAGSAAGCCRDVDPTRDACSFPGERSLFWMLECGARAARFRWTAPTQAVDVWFSASMVTSNAGNDALGDGVTLVRQRLHPAGGSQDRTAALGSCAVASGSPRGGAAWVLALAFLGLLVRARGRFIAGALAR